MRRRHQNAAEGEGSCGAGGGHGPGDGSVGPDEGIHGGGPGNQESSHSVAALGHGSTTGRRQWLNKQRRLKKKTPKLPLAACTSIEIFRGCTIADRG
jgi:hypothetical protein